MSFNSCRPHAPLDSVIEMFWHLGDIAAGQDAIGLPKSFVEIVFNLGDAFSMQKNGVKALYDKVWITGFQQSPMLVRSTGRVELMGVRFKPFGHAAFFRESMSEFSNQSVGLENVWSRDILTVWDALQHTKSLPERFLLIENFLLRKYIEIHKIRTPLTNALSMLGQHGLVSIRIGQLCREIGMTRKSLNEQFKKYVGLSPSEYRKLVLFNRILRDISHNPGRMLVDVAYRNRYFDQAHFIKDFSSMADRTPGEYAKLSQANPSLKVLPNLIPLDISLARP